MALRDTNLLNIINLNDSLKTSISDNNLSDMIKIIYQMRIFVGKMVFNLHKLHLRINDKLSSNDSTDVSNEYYYMSMYENIIDSIKQLINRYENNYLLKKDGDSVNHNFTKFTPQQSNKDVNINITIHDFLNDLKVIGKSPELLSPDKFKEQLVFTDTQPNVDLFEDMNNETNEGMNNEPNEFMNKLFEGMNIEPNEFMNNEPNEGVNNEPNELMNNEPNEGVNNEPNELMNDLFEESEVNQMSDLRLNNNLLSNDDDTMYLLLDDNDNVANQSLQNDWNQLENEFSNNNTKFSTVNCSSNPELANNLNYPGHVSVVKVNGNNIEQLNTNLDYRSLKQLISPNVSNVPTISTILNAQNTNSSNYVLTLYCSPTCKHCTDFMRTWNELKQMVQYKPIRVEYINCEENGDQCSHIYGTPTISIQDESTGKSVEYKGKRDLNSISTFIDSYMSGSSQESVVSETDGYESDTEIDINQLIVDQKQQQNQQQKSDEDFLNELLDYNEQFKDEPVRYAHPHPHPEEHSFESLLRVNPENQKKINELSNKKKQEYDQTYMILYYHKTCPASIDFLPDWNDFKTSYATDYPTEPVNFFACVCEESQDKELFKSKYQIKTFPSIDLIKNNVRYRFNSFERTPTNLIKFIQSPQLGIQSGGNKVNVMKFYADWCGHCTTFKPIWDEVKNSLQSSKISFKEFNADIHKRELEHYDVQSFPTILIENNGDIIKYTDQRNVKSLKSFIKKYK